MIELVSKVKRKGKVYLTFNIKPEGKALEAMEAGGALRFRAWQFVHTDGKTSQDPPVFIYEISSTDEDEVKVPVEAGIFNAVSIEVGIVQEGVTWFETLVIEF